MSDDMTRDHGRRRAPEMALAALTFILALMACAAPGSGGTTGGTSGQPPAPTLTATPNATLASYVGAWTAHDDKMTIAANDAGSETWNAGPCSPTDSASGLCEGTGALTFQANTDGSITGTYTTVSYQSSSGQLPSGFQPISGYPTQGATITLNHDGAHLVSAAFQSSNWTYCDAFALGAGWTQCGA